MGARVLDLPGLTVAAMRNRAAAAARGQVIAFIDADHEIDIGWVPAAVRVFSDPGVAAAGATYLSPPDGTWVQRLVGVLRGQTQGHHEVAWLASGNLLVRRALFQDLHGFDESLETCEDVDLCWRIRTAGRRLVADEGLRSVHLGDPRTLRDLFRAERWRGRNNLRASFRSWERWREMPSALLPLLGLASTTVGLVSIVAIPWAPGWGSTGALGLIAIPALGFVRVVRGFLRGMRVRASELPAVALVATTYEAARAAALCLPAGHRNATRRPAAAA
jgi:Glycosyl transferase family group 2